MRRGKLRGLVVGLVLVTLALSLLSVAVVVLVRIAM